MIQKHVELVELCEISIGRTPSRKEASFWGEGHPWLSIGDMNQGRDIVSTKECITTRAVNECNCKIVEPGTVLLSFKLSIGKVGIAKRPLFTNEAIAALPIRDQGRLDATYLSWALKAINLSEGLDRAAKGLTLNKAKLEKIKIPLPTIHVQKRIAAILDRADSLRVKRISALRQLDSLFLSFFVEMFGDPSTNQMSWPTTTLEHLASKITDGEHLTPKRTESGIKLLSARNVQDGYLDFSDVDYIDAAEYARIAKRCNPQRGDILISCSGTIGRVAALETDEPIGLVRSAALIKPDPKKVNSKFLEIYLRTPCLRQLMKSRAHSSSQANLFQGPIRALPVFLPPVALQELFESRTRFVQTIRTRHVQACSIADKLFDSLQQQAFRGQL